MDFTKKIILAPMAGVTDYPFRKIARRYGADYCISEMVSSKAMFFEDKKTALLAEIRDDDRPIGIQIFGHEPSVMANSAFLLSTGSYKYAKSNTPPDIIDINMGCPVKKIVTSGDGSALLNNPKLCGEIIKECVNASRVPVTVKIRAGWDKESINCVEIAKIAEANGASAICVHGRTRSQMYEPFANWEYIRQVKESVSIPVIGNGDIYSASDALRMLEQTGCDGVMIGRGAMGNPFIFEEIKCALTEKAYTPPTIFEKIKVAKEHALLLTEEKDERLAICESRKHMAWYLKGAKGSASVRLEINGASSLSQLFEILDRYENQLRSEAESV
ncbi:MAG: tRNA dihydrouridine synthase DusB [Clostridia bacterium]|nr:tRNA dihydrouridine synthase DusB [Clostridia bacterium]